MRQCASTSARGLVKVLFSKEKEDEVSVAQENQAEWDVTPQGEMEEKEVKKEVINLEPKETQPKTMKDTEATKKSDPTIISDEDSDVDII